MKNLEQWKKYLERKPTVKKYFNAHGMSDEQSYDAFQKLKNLPYEYEDNYRRDFNKTNTIIAISSILLFPIAPGIGSMLPFLIVSACMKVYGDKKHIAQDTIEIFANNYEHANELHDIKKIIDPESDFKLSRTKFSLFF